MGQVISRKCFFLSSSSDEQNNMLNGEMTLIFVCAIVDMLFILNTRCLYMSCLNCGRNVFEVRCTSKIIVESSENCCAGLLTVVLNWTFSKICVPVER